MKKIVRFSKATIHIVPNTKPRAVVSFPLTMHQNYIPNIVNASFDDNGKLTRFETHYIVYVQVKNA